MNETHKPKILVAICFGAFDNVYNMSQCIITRILGLNGMSTNKALSRSVLVKC